MEGTRDYLRSICVRSAIANISVTIDSHLPIAREWGRVVLAENLRPTVPDFTHYEVSGVLSHEGTLSLYAKAALGPRGPHRPRAQHLNVILDSERIIALFGTRVAAIEEQWVNEEGLSDNFDQYLEALRRLHVTDPAQATAEEHVQAIASTFSGRILERLGFTDIEMRLEPDHRTQRQPAIKVVTRFQRPARAPPLPTPHAPLHVSMGPSGWDIDLSGSLVFTLRSDANRNATLRVDTWVDGSEFDDIVSAIRAWIVTRQLGAQFRVEFSSRVSRGQRIRILALLNRVP